MGQARQYHRKPRYHHRQAEPGYYWDEETGLYYVGSRYYDPEIRRFISADDMTILNDDERSLEHSALFP